MYRILKIPALCAALAFPALNLAAPPQAPVAAADVVPAIWQHHKARINYVGFTTAFSCDALEQHVRDILVYLGARKDAKVVSSGCPRGREVPSNMAWIDAEFSTLTPADAAAAGSSDNLNAHWVPRQINAHEPSFMGDGDCELIEQMKDFVAKNFALRDLKYRTECVPHQMTVDAFAIRGDALLAVDEKASAKAAAARP